MVKVKEGMLHADGSIDVEQWLQRMGEKGYAQYVEQLRSACALSQLASVEHAIETGESCLQQGLAMADVLADLSADQETLIAAILFVSAHYADLSLEDVEEQFGQSVAHLVAGVEKMSAITHLNRPSQELYNKNQIENVRKMLLAMVDDVRVVLIKLTERLCLLRSAAPISLSMRQQIASEAMDIYAPLANRLGIGAIKWEMEDLAFRYLHSDEYKSIAQGLKDKRLDRDRYVNLIVEQLKEQLSAMGLEHYAVYGRSKHIHSIYKKMMRKQLTLNQIYDATAVRILVDTQDLCYLTLAMIEQIWQQVPHEFDDYITQPKLNGYQSLHMAVDGPEGRVFEVQIRTFSMHEQAEMGVAAHWKYKEGIIQDKASYERKIEWLREVLAWHHDMSSKNEVFSAMESQFIEDRVYVFTPDGDILDLSHGVTALDFAYHVHTDLGHRCRGAKVNGRIVPLTYTLKTGDCVDILTGKNPRPSRDWINPHLLYLKTSRAKAKVLHWFKQQDSEKNCEEGREILEKSLKTLGLKIESVTNLLSQFRLHHIHELFVRIGRGEIKLAQVLSRLSSAEKSVPLIKITPRTKINDSVRNDICIEGVGQLLTHMARCCQPLPGDQVLGYVTLGRGVSVHKQDCQNILHATEKQKKRFLEVSWGSNNRDRYQVNIVITAFDRSTLLRDITALIAAERVHVFGLETKTQPQENTTNIKLTLEIDGINQLSRLLNQLENVPNVIEARRSIL